METMNRVGQKAKMLVRERMWVDVRIVGESSAFGRTVLTVEPVAGTGSLRVNEDSLKNFSTPKGGAD